MLTVRLLVLQKPVLDVHGRTARLAHETTPAVTRDDAMAWNDDWQRIAAACTAYGARRTAETFGQFTVAADDPGRNRRQCPADSRLERRRAARKGQLERNPRIIEVALQLVDGRAQQACRRRTRDARERDQFDSFQPLVPGMNREQAERGLDDRRVQPGGRRIRGACARQSLSLIRAALPVSPRR